MSDFMSLIVNGHNIILIAITSFLVSLILVPLCKKVAIHVNALDIPNERKVHKSPMPRLEDWQFICRFDRLHVIWTDNDSDVIDSYSEFCHNSVRICR